MAHVKGSALKSSLVFIQEKLGQEGLHHIVQELSASDAEILTSPILQSSWYEFTILLSLMTVAEKKLPREGGNSPTWNLGRFSAEYGLKTLYRIFFKVADPHFIIGKATQVYATFYDSGEMRLISSDHGSATVRLAGFNQPHTLFCERLMGWMQRTVELSGGSSVQLEHPRCLARGDRFCEYVAIWK